MIELLFILYILLAFIFPLPMLGLALCLGIAYLIYREYLLLKNQPAEGKRIIIVSIALQSANWFLSFLLSLSMAFGVHIIFVENIYLFSFNLIFSLAIAIRWFDFTYRLFQSSIRSQLKDSDFSSAPFVVCLGYRGSGTPIFMDAGYLSLAKPYPTFTGLFFKHQFTPHDITFMERKSSEKIKLSFSSPPEPLRPDTLLIILKGQFYPFKLRPARDDAFKSLQTICQTRS